MNLDLYINPNYSQIKKGSSNSEGVWNPSELERSFAKFAILYLLQCR